MLYELLTRYQFWGMLLVAVGGGVLGASLMVSRIERRDRKIAQIANNLEHLSGYIDKEVARLWGCVSDTNDLASKADYHIGMMLLHDEVTQKDQDTVNEVSAAFDQLDE